MAATLKLDIISDFNDKGIQQATRGTQNLNKAAGIAAVGLAAAGAAALVLAKGAAQDAAGAERLAVALRNTTGATDAQIASTETWIAAQGKALGVSDDELRPALQSLATATGDVTKAQELAGLAMDVAAARGVPVSKAADAIAKAYAGQGTALARLVPGIDKAVLASGDFSAIQAEVARVTGGQAAAAAGTAAGQFAIFQLGITEAGESIGAALLPALSALLPVLVGAADFVARNTTAVVILAGVAATLAAAVLAVSAAYRVYTTVGLVVAAVDKLMTSTRLRGIAAMVAQRGINVAMTAAALVYAGVTKIVTVATKVWTAGQWLLNAALTANPIGLVVVAIALLIGGLVLAYKKSDTFRGIVNSVASVLRGAFASALRTVSGAISNVVGWLQTAWSWVQRLIDRLRSIRVPSIDLNPFNGGFSARRAAAPMGAAVQLGAAPQLAGRSAAAATGSGVGVRSTSSVLGTVTINVSGALDPVQTGRAVVDALQRYQRTTGKRVLA